MKYSIGDKVKLNTNQLNIDNFNNYTGYKDYEGIIRDWHSEGTYDVEIIKFNNIIKNISEYNLDLVKSYSETLMGKTMNIKEKFALALTKEPMKTFRKVGITNGDDLLTDDGQKVFLSWLLNKKFADEFKTEVADDMLKEIKAEKE